MFPPLLPTPPPSAPAHRYRQGGAVSSLLVALSTRLCHRTTAPRSRPKPDSCWGAPGRRAAAVSAWTPLLAPNTAAAATRRASTAGRAVAVTAWICSPTRRTAAPAPTSVIRSATTASATTPSNTYYSVIVSECSLKTCSSYLIIHNTASETGRHKFQTTSPCLDDGPVCY